MSSLSDVFFDRLRMPLGRRCLPIANTTLGERLTSDAYASEVIKFTFDKSNKTVVSLDT
jgi:hypothetical protein